MSVEPALVDPGMLDALAEDAPSVAPILALVELFGDDSAVLLAQMRDALRHGDDDGVRRLAHVLRGGSAMIGAIAVADICAAIERGDSGGDAVDAGAWLDRLAHALAPTLEALRDLLGRHRHASPA